MKSMTKLGLILASLLIAAPAMPALDGRSNVVRQRIG